MDASPHFPSTRCVRLGTGSFIREVLDKDLSFRINGQTVKAHTFNSDTGVFFCQFVGGGRDGEEYLLTLGDVETLLNARVEMVTDAEAAPAVPNMYTQEVHSKATRAMLIALLGLTAAIIGIRCIEAPKAPLDVPAKKAHKDGQLRQNP